MREINREIKVIDMCTFYRNDTTHETYTTFLQSINDCVVIIKNVPCVECDLCGEKYYSDEVASKLEQIINSVKSLPQEFAIFDYTHAA